MEVEDDEHRMCVCVLDLCSLEGSLYTDLCLALEVTLFFKMGCSSWWWSVQALGLNHLGPCRAKGQLGTFVKSFCAQLLNSRIRWLVCVRAVVTLEVLGTQCRWQEGMMFSATVVFTALCLGLVQILLNSLFSCFSFSVLFFWNKIWCSPGFPHHLAVDDLEFLVLTLPSVQC